MVIFALGCLSLVQRLLSSVMDKSYIGVLVADIKPLVVCLLVGIIQPCKASFE
jgi:hypothetical protein